MENKKLNVCGLVGICLEVLGIFIFGLPCSIAGLILGIIGLTKATNDSDKVLPIISIVCGGIELLIIIISIAILL